MFGASGPSRRLPPASGLARPTAQSGHNQPAKYAPKQRLRAQLSLPSTFPRNTMWRARSQATQYDASTSSRYQVSTMRRCETGRACPAAHVTPPSHGPRGNGGHGGRRSPTAQTWGDGASVYQPDASLLVYALQETPVIARKEIPTLDCSACSSVAMRLGAPPQAKPSPWTSLEMRT